MIHYVQADAGRIPLADKSVDLVLGSPPYCDARTYGIGAQRKCQAWVDWMLGCTREAVRVSRGLVLWVCAGVTRKWCYQPGPEGLLYEWWKQGGHCWRPCYWHRVGIPGSGGKQWLRADIEYVLCFTDCKGMIPWADNTANGHPPKWAPGGEMSYRVSDGARVNHSKWGKTSHGGTMTKDGTRDFRPRPSHEPGPNRRADGTMKSVRRCTRGKAGGDTVQETAYDPPVLANPGCLVKGIKVGGGLMGHKAAHENEAPYPVKLASWFIRSHCPKNGLVLDPFSGSGTTAHAAFDLGRHAIAMDLRANQCELAMRRCGMLRPAMFMGRDAHEID
jgi:hypothetical protein